jgi:membrane protein DedA with SNARE-associated domain
MNDLTEYTIAFVKEHHVWAAPVVFVLAFSESFAFISLIVPATAILFAVGGLIAAANLDFWSIWLAATFGATAGDWAAYDIAVRFRDRVAKTWPFSRNPALLARGIEFFRRWGTIAVFIGRFFGPLRAVVPIAAGLNNMPWLKFQIANAVSAAVWAAGILAPGFLGVRWLVG